ncbi:CD80-like C2-set immunoglobulin domain [Mactra antiquata]
MTPANNTVDVTENTAVEFHCTTSTSRPAASVYWFIHPNGNSSNITQITENITTMTDYNELSVITSTLRFVLSRHHNNMKIFCSANNSVNTSPVMSIKKLLNVLYKADDPYIIQGSEYRVIENTQGTLSCSVKGGNPTPTLSWSCNKFSPTNQSVIKSNGNTTTTFKWIALRNHNGTCTCISQQTKFQTEAVDVSLVVLYAASVTSFFVEGFPNQTVTVNEGGTVPFTCTADSNPTAVTTLSDESKIIQNVPSNNLKYNITKANCSDAGIFVCTAKNEYIGEENVQKEVQLFVNCYPRATGVIDTNITSEKNNTITIVFNVIAYPPPTFTWWQFLNETWTDLNNDDNFDIQSSNHQSNLTIRKVGMKDFTSYKVIVENDIGMMEQPYALSQYDKPDPPTGFRHIESQTTTTSIHLEWKPGFDNGPSQTFFIKYKRSSDTLWNYIYVPDNGEQTMVHTLTELTEDTQYEIVILSSNVKGNSSESSVLVTTAKAISRITQSLGPLIGGVIGGTVGLIIIIALVVFVGRRNGYINDCSGKLRKSDGINNTADDHAYYNVGRIDATAANQGSDDTRSNRPKRDANRINHTTEEASYYNVESVPVPTYELINRNYMDSAQYSTLQQTEQGTTSDVTIGDKKEIYENLKIQVF